MIASTIVCALPTLALAAETKPEPAADAACVAARAERNKLATPALRNLLKQDPNAVASTLSAPQIGDLRRLIELDEKVMFACRLEAHAALGGGNRKNPRLVDPATGRPRLAMAPPPVRKPPQPPGLRTTTGNPRLRPPPFPLPVRNPGR